MLATKTARWTALAVLTCLAVVAATWFVLVSPRRAQADEIRQQSEAQAASNDALELQVAQLKAQFAKLPEKKAELAAIQAQMPVSAAMPELLRSLDEMAAATGVVLKEVTPAAAAELPSEQPAPATGSDGAPSGEASTETGSAADPATASDPQAAVVAGGLRVVEIPITVTVSGDYFETVAFLKTVQTEITRVFLVTSLKVTTPQTADTGGTVSLTIGGKVFALPDTPTDDTPSAAGQSAGSTGTAAPGDSATTAEGTTTS